MKDFLLGFIAPFIGLVLLCIIVFTGIVYITVAVEVNTMQQLGFKARQVNFTCVAISNNEWVDCYIVKYRHHYN